MSSRQASGRTVAVVAAVVLAILAAITLWFVPASMEADLTERTGAAIKAAHFDDVTVAVSGRTVTLSGFVEDDAARAAAVQVASDVWGVGGVDDQMQSGGKAQAPEVYRFGAIWDGRTLTLSGFMPSRDAREELITHSRDTLPSAEIADALQVSTDAPDANWSLIAQAGIAAMRQLNSASFVMAGTDITFKGVAAAEADRAFAKDILDRLPAPFTAKIDISVGLPVAPTAAVPQGYRFGAAFDGTSIAVSGAVPSAAVKTQLAAAFKTALPNTQLADRTKVDPAVPDGAWTDAVLLIAGQFGSMSSATLDMNGRAIALSVLAKDAVAKDKILAALKNLPVAYKLTLELSAEGEGPPAPQSFGGEGSPAYACQTAYDGALAGSPVAFASGKSALPASARNLITEMARIAGTCPEARIQITGHTDASGPAAGNIKLSGERAKAVADALVAAGVEKSRVSAKGFGADRPIAPNDNDADKARNRRIEVIVRP